MPARIRGAPPVRRIAGAVRARIERGGERLWRLEDFRDLPFAAVAQALSRLARAGMVERLSKGTYYRARETTFGMSRPNPSAVQMLTSRTRPLFPSGAAAANLLGFTTQATRRVELATTASSIPRKLLGPDAVVHTRRPATWARLSEVDAALLDFLRRGGREGELSPEETISRTISLLSESDRFRRLAGIAGTEPPRVRAMMGALGERMGAPARSLRPLRDSLNPLSRFDFGLYGHLPNARTWQAKDRGP